MDKLNDIKYKIRGVKMELAPPERRADSCIQYRYIVTALAFFAFVNVYTMRVNLSVAIVEMVSSPIIKASYNTTIAQSCPELIDNSGNETLLFHEGDFDWTIQEQDYIQSTFFYGYVVTNIIGGRFADIFGSGGAIFASIITIVSPQIAHLGSSWFAASRVLVGLGVGVIYPAIHCSLALWYPQRERGLMYSIIHSGARFSSAVTFPMSGWLCLTSAGWPSAFYVFGIFGVVWCILWAMFMYDNPENHPFISEKELKYISSNKEEEGQAAEQIPIPWISVLTSVPVWVTAIALFGAQWGFNTLLSELATYMSYVLHFNLQSNGLLDALPYICDMVFTIISGYIADWLLAKKYLSVTNTRKLFTALGSFLPAASLLILTFLGCNRNAIVGVMVLAVGFGGTRIPGSAVAIVDMAPNFSGTLMGICNGMSQLSGVISLPIVGLILGSEETEMKWNYVFYLAVAVYVVTALAFLFFGTAKLQSWSTTGINEYPRWIMWIRDKFGRL